MSSSLKGERVSRARATRKQIPVKTVREGLAPTPRVQVERKGVGILASTGASQTG